MARTPIHPDTILTDKLREIRINGTTLARIIGVPPNRISQIVAGKRIVTADTSLRLGKFFGTGPELWLNLQKTYELRLAQKGLGEILTKIPHYSAVAR
ncbi:MAG: HigA family addiction module antitoxin [Pseudomonadota bacterium]|nr:HigA family addiction module antitoxin [Pseudomonadota bacterium]